MRLVLYVLLKWFHSIASVFDLQVVWLCGWLAGLFIRVVHPGTLAMWWVSMVAFSLFG